MSDILYSIIIPTFNREISLVEAVKSALDCIPNSSEIIVVNDGRPFSSTTFKFLNGNNIVCLTTGGHTGAGAARNFGARNAKGNWLFFLDDDDLITPNYWISVAEYISKNLNEQFLDYGFCQSMTFSDRASMNDFSQDGPFEFSFQRSTESGLKSKLAGFGVGFWVSKVLFDTVGGINQNIRVNEDTDFCLRLLGAHASCHTTSSIGALVFSGSHSKNSAPSTTKSFSAANRMIFFQTIISQHESLLASDNSTAFWLFKRFIKMAARAKQSRALFTASQSKILFTSQKFFLLFIFFGEFVVGLIKRRK